MDGIEQATGALQSAGVPPGFIAGLVAVAVLGGLLVAALAWLGVIRKPNGNGHDKPGNGNGTKATLDSLMSTVSEGFGELKAESVRARDRDGEIHERINTLADNVTVGFTALRDSVHSVSERVARIESARDVWSDEQRRRRVSVGKEHPNDRQWKDRE